MSEGEFQTDKALYHSENNPNIAKIPNPADPDGVKLLAYKAQYGQPHEFK
jgi:hypothetical protein